MHVESAVALRFGAPRGLWRSRVVLAVMAIGLGVLVAGVAAAAPANPSAPPLCFTYLGNAGWEIRDATHVVMVDPYISQFREPRASSPNGPDGDDPVPAPDEKAIDSHLDSQTAPSPFDVLLASIAACSATDVVAILSKQRTPAQALRVRVEAQRVETVPRRLASAVLHFSISAPGATSQKVARAVELSITKYCSVRSSLASDVPVTWTIDLKG